MNLISRTSALFAGALLLCGGAAALVWDTNMVAGTPEYVTAPGLVAAAAAPWWPWAVAGVGVLCVLVGVRWLLALAPARRSKSVRIGGAQPDSVSVTLAAVADAAATALEAHPAVHRGRAKITVDRGAPTLELTVTAASLADLHHVAAAAETANAQLARVLGGTPVAVRTMVRVAATDTRHVA